MTKINFVRHRRRELTKLEIQDRRLLRYATLAIGGVIILTIAIMVVRFFLAYSNSQTTQSITKLTQEIATKQTIENEYLVFMAKAKVISELFGLRREKQEALAYFSSLFDPSIIISQLSYDGDTQALSFTLRAPHVFALQSVFDTLRSSKVRETYPSFRIDGINRDDIAAYRLTVSLPLQATPIKAADSDAPTGEIGLENE